MKQTEIIKTFLQRAGLENKTQGVAIGYMKPIGAKDAMEAVMEKHIAFYDRMLQALPLHHPKRKAIEKLRGFSFHEYQDFIRQSPSPSNEIIGNMIGVNNEQERKRLIYHLRKRDEYEAYLSLLFCCCHAYRLLSFFFALEGSTYQDGCPHTHRIENWGWKIQNVRVAMVFHAI